MANHLVERLQAEHLKRIPFGLDYPQNYVTIFSEAADRIEALQADYVTANEGLLAAHQRVKILEAVLKRIGDYVIRPGSVAYELQQIARAALERNK